MNNEENIRSASNQEELKPIPQKIFRKSDHSLEIQWMSGESTEILFSQLRFECRCAQCVDEWTRVRRIKIEEIKSDIAPTRIEPMGRYAIQIDWNDGHKTGIYPYDLLYAIAKKQVSNGEMVE